MGESPALQSRIVKALIVLFIVVPLIVSSIAFLWQNPGPAGGNSGAARFSQFNPLTPNVPSPPTPPPEVQDILNYTIGYVDRSDVFLRIRSGCIYRDGKRLPRYTSSTASTPTGGLGISVHIERNLTVASLLASSLNIPTYIPSYAFYPTNVTYSSPSKPADPLRELYPEESEVEIYTLFVQNASNIDREYSSGRLSEARAYFSSHPRLEENPEITTTAYDVASSLRLSNNEKVFSQVAVVLAYMYGKIALKMDANFTNPLYSLDFGYASPNDRLSTFVTLLRLVGVPATLSYGFIPETNSTGGLYEVKIKDFRSFVEIFDGRSRLLFDPRSTTDLLLESLGKDYPVNVYKAYTYSSIEDVEGGDSVIAIGDQLVPLFVINSSDYSETLSVTAYAEVLGAPIETDNVTVVRYYLGNGSENELVEEFVVASNSTGHAYAEIVVNATVEGGIHMLAFSYNGRVIAVQLFGVTVPTTIGGLSYENLIYAPESVFVHETLLRAYFFSPRVFLEARLDARPLDRRGGEAKDAVLY